MHRRFRRSVLMILTAASLLGMPLATQPARSAPRTGPIAQAQNVLVEGVVGEIRKLNPLLATYNTVDRDITALIFEGLMTTNHYGEVVPDLAESWTITPNGLDYLIVLRDDVLWQDGIPFTAEDVVFTMRLMSDPDFPGATALHEFWRTVEVDALDTRTIRFRLTQPLGAFLDHLRIGILPAHVLEGVPVAKLAEHPFNLSPIGTGPYQLEALTASDGQIDGAQLRVAPVYRQRPEGQDGYTLDRVIFRTYPTPGAALEAFRQGEVNSVGTIPPDLQDDARRIPGLSLYTTVRAQVGVLIYNWDREAVRFVRNPRARLALAHAIDREALVEAHLAGTAIPADSPLVPTSWAYVPDSPWPEYDPARAQTLLDSANLVIDAPVSEATAVPPEDEQDTPPPEDDTAESDTPEATATPTATPEPAPALALRILTRDDPALVALLEDIAAAWEQLDFTVDIEAVDARTLQARLEAGEFDTALLEYSFEPNADPDPYVFWHQGQSVDGQNFGAMDDRRVSEALEKARLDPYGVNRIVHYREFQRLFAERAPALVLYYPLYIYGTDSRLEGVQLGFLSSPSDRFRTIQEWTFQP